jgi:hypothetical protein
MAVRVAARLAAQWFTPASQEADISPARFLLKPLGTIEQLDLGGMIDSARQGQAADAVLRMVVKDWENVVDDAGAPLAFDAGRILDLPPELVLELAAEATRLAAMTRAEIKN